MHVDKRKYNNLQSATISLQCRARRGAAKKEFDQIKREAKDMGKIKEHNEKLKMEMASLKAMLQAQAASDADKVKSKKAIAEKQEEINRLEARIAQLEGELENEKENVKRLENNLNVQKEDNTRLSQDLQYQKEMALALRGASTPAKHSRNLSGNELQKVPGKHARNFSANELLSTVPAEAVVDAVVVGHTISPEALAQHRAEVARLEEELEEERRMSRAARIQIKNLRAAIVDKGVMDVTASTEVISDNLSEMSGSEIDRSDVPVPSDLDSQLR
jgi:DNA repair exonuclease SbcCD ATPase subunit